MQEYLRDINEEQEEGENNNVTEFKLLQGGKEPPSTDANWLSELEVGTVFLVQDKNKPTDFTLGQFRLMEKTEKSCFIATMIEDKIQTFPVNPVRFCNRYSRWEVLAVIKTQEDIDNLKEDLKEDEPRMENKVD